MYTYCFIVEGECVFEAELRATPEAMLGEVVSLLNHPTDYKVVGFVIKGESINLLLREIPAIGAAVRTML